MEIDFGPPEIEPDEIQKNHLLGKGSFGTVYQGRCRKIDVAIKVLHNQIWDKKAIDEFQHEVKVMRRITHPNVNLFLGACTIPSHMMIVTELMEGDLESLIKEKKKKISLFTKLKMAKDAACGILWLHSSNPQIIHRDLKPSNLLYGKNYICKIADFGLSEMKKKNENLRDKNNAKGTPLWMAPEVLQGLNFDEKVDIYSFGLILWFLLTSQEPFSEYNKLEEFSNAICVQKVRPPIPQDTPSKLKDLIERSWHDNPSIRPTFDQIINELDDILIDLSIEDPIGNSFWKSNLRGKFCVSWEEFFRLFNSQFTILSFKKLNLSDNPQLRFFKYLIVDQTKKEIDTVTIEKFNSILKWFGPLSNENCDILRRIYQIISQDWFFGDISTSDSESALANREKGTFLIRFSSSNIGCYTISKVDNDNSISHERIQYCNGYFQIQNRNYPTLLSLIDNEKNNLGLYYSCPGGGIKRWEQSTTYKYQNLHLNQS